jgi:hypothetical protein
MSGDRLEEPASPSRVRIVRPSFYRNEATGTLAAEVRDFLIGLMTLADDVGWLRWRPVEIAAALYAFVAPAQRARHVEQRAQRLVDAGLLRIEACGCAILPSLIRDHGQKNGSPTTVIWAWHHKAHPAGSRQVETSPANPPSVSASSSASSSSSFSDSVKGLPGSDPGTEAVPAREGPPLNELPPVILQKIQRTTTTGVDRLDPQLVERTLEFLRMERAGQELWITYSLALPAGGTANEHLQRVLDEIARQRDKAATNGRAPVTAGHARSKEVGR